MATSASSKLQQMIAANKTKAAPSAPKEETNSTIVTGIASEVSSPDTPIPEAPTDLSVYNEALAKAAKAVYKDEVARPLGRFARLRGGMLSAVNGYFYALTDDDVTVLNQYVSTGRVTLVQ